MGKSELDEALKFRGRLEETLHKVVNLRPSCRNRNLLIRSILQMPDFDHETAYKHFCVLEKNDCANSAEDLCDDYNKHSIDAGLGKYFPD